jgi:DNA-binding CsgD family transcriptional regulator
MATLQDLLKRHLEARHMSVKTLAERLGMSYPTVLALIKKGSVPRSQEHRDALRSELELSSDAWAAVFASSMREGVEIPTEGPLTLQQLVIKAMLVQGYSEQTLAGPTRPSWG